MKPNSEATEDKEWESRVSAGKGHGFAKVASHVESWGPGDKLRSNVNAAKKEFSRDSIHTGSRKGKRSGKQRKI